MIDIVVPQNTIDSARPADLSFAGEHQGLVNTASRALELRRATEALRSQEALTKAYKDATDPKTGAINFATVKEELKNNPNYTLGAGEDTAGIGQNAERQKSTADEFNRSNAELEALYNRGGITFPQFQKALAFNKQGENLAGVNNAGAYGSGAYLQTILATKPEVREVNTGGETSIFKLNPLGDVNTPLNKTNTLVNTITPGEKARIESQPVNVQNQTPGGDLIMTQKQPVVGSRGNVNLLNGPTVGSTSQDTTKQNAAFQEAVQQAPNVISSENTNLSNLTKAILAADSNRGRPDYTPLGETLATIIGNYNPQTMNRAMLMKTIATYNANNLAPTVDQQKHVADQLGNLKMPDSVLIAALLASGKHASNLLEAKYLLAHPSDLKGYQNMASQYGPHGNIMGVSYTLHNLLKTNPHVAKRAIMLLNSVMPDYITELNNGMVKLQNAQKQGLLPAGTVQ